VTRRQAEPAFFAGAAYDPAVAGGMIAWQRPNGIALLADGPNATGLPGRDPALAPGRVAWRQRDARGADHLHARAIAANGVPREAASARPPAELGRPALAGRLLLYHQAGPRGSRILGLDLATGRRRVLRREAGAMLTNPSTDGERMLYVRATGRTQELRIGPLRRRATHRDRTLLIQPSPGQRDVEHERGRERHRNVPLPPRAEPGIAETLWTTALGGGHAYVTRLRTSRREPPAADIVRVPA
jgi:hypothetical protein